MSMAVRPRGRGHHCATSLLGLAALLLLVPLLPGCIEVSTVVTRRGFIQREVVIRVPEALAESVNVREHFDSRVWDMSEKRTDEEIHFICKAKRGKDSPDDFPGVALEMSATGSAHVYRYTEAIRVTDFIPPETAEANFADTELTLAIRMPGKVTTWSPLTRGDQPADDTVVFRLKLGDLAEGSQYTVSVESEAKRLDHKFLLWMVLVVIIGGLISVLTSSGPWRYITSIMRDD